MVTGQLLMISTETKNKNTLEINFKRMSIQLNLSGLSFCIFNPALNCIESIYNLPINPSSPFSVIDAQLREYLITERALCQDFDTIKVLHNNEHFAFVPKPFFATSHLYQYLKLNVKEYKNEIISHDEVPSVNAVNVYIPNTPINKVLRETYGIFEYEHFTTSLLRIILTHNPFKKDAIYGHFEKMAFHLVVFQEGKLAFFNRFSFEAEMDMLYYLLYSLERLDIDTEVTPMYLLGDIIRNSEKYLLIYNYIRFIYFLPPQKNNPFCQNMDTILARQNFVLTHSF